MEGGVPNSKIWNIAMERKTREGAAVGVEFYSCTVVAWWFLGQDKALGDAGWFLVGPKLVMLQIGGKKTLILLMMETPEGCFLMSLKNLKYSHFTNKEKGQYHLRYLDYKAINTCCR